VRSRSYNSIGETCIEDKSTSPPPHFNFLAFRRSVIPTSTQKRPRPTIM
jgi:hypothetical protein